MILSPLIWKFGAFHIAILKDMLPKQSIQIKFTSAILGKHERGNDIQVTMLNFGIRTETRFPAQ